MDDSLSTDGIIPSTVNLIYINKKENINMFNNLPQQVQEKIRRFLQMGDFRSAKEIYDSFLLAESK